MVLHVKQLVRQANENDLPQLANLVHFEIHVHRHLDYRPPLDWINQHPFLVLEKEGEITATLACPPDPPQISWIRLFATSARYSAIEAWELLFNHALNDLVENYHPSLVAAIPVSNWFIGDLIKSGFQETHQIVMLNWEGSEPPKKLDRISSIIRPMVYNDLPTVQEIDGSSFVPMWQNSYACLEHSFRLSNLATVVELDGYIVGYQISIATSRGGHLARLAVTPSFQGKGIGIELLYDLLNRLILRRIHLLTVNTQKDNFASIALYNRAGFTKTGEELPIFQLNL